MKPHQILLILFGIVTAIYSIANPFLIIITNVVWAYIYERETVPAWSAMVALYVLPTLPIFLTALAWYFLAVKRYVLAFAFLCLPAAFVLGYLFIEPLIS